MKLEDRTAKCGCVICICNDEEQCQGCGATSCKDFPDCQVQDLHVIGTCGECKFIGEKSITLSQHGAFFCSINGRYEDKDFGCIHWAQKERP